MDKNFNTVWNIIQKHLTVDATIRNWSADKEYTGGIFQIVNIDTSSITVSSDGISKPRRISIRDFEKVFEVWESYYKGNFPRGRLTERSQNTTYIISILHWENSKHNLTRLTQN